jgi:glutamine amidotransferase
MKKDVDFYFVHSYFFDVKQNEDLLAVTDYEADFPCAVTNGRSVVGVQFHPEKSQDSGLKILQNFCEWDGASC